MPIIINPQNNKQVKKAIKYLHTRKQETDPLLQFLLETSKQYIQYYLLQNPQLFTNNNTYTQYKNTHKDTHFQNHIKELYTQKNVDSTTLAKIKQLTTQNTNTHLKKIQKDKNIPTTLNKQVISQDLKNTLQNKQNTEYTKTINHTIQKTQKTLQNDNNTSIKEKIRQLREDDKKEIKRQHKRIQKNTENRVLWREMMMRQKNKPAYKTWQQTPNPHTRHTLTNGQTVPLEEKFIVINDKTGDTDYMDHPGDWFASASNTANCLCNIKFTNQEPDTDYNTTRKEAEDNARQIREAVQKRREKRSQRKQATGKNKPTTIQPTTNNDSEDTIKDKTENKQKEKQPITIDDISPEAQQVLNDFHKKYKNAPIEHCYAVDVQTGEIYGHTTGDSGEVKPPQIPPGKQGIIIHNHPTTTGYDPLSSADIDYLVTTPNVRYMIATNQHRTQIAQYTGTMGSSEIREITWDMDQLHYYIKDKREEEFARERHDYTKKVKDSSKIFGRDTKEHDQYKKRLGEIMDTKLDYDMDEEFTSRTNQLLNDSGVKCWDIKHQDKEYRIREALKKIK